MRRAFLALLGTATGTAVLIGLKTHLPEAHSAPTRVSAPLGPGPTTGGAVPPPDARPPSQGPPASRSGVPTSGPPGGTPTTGPATPGNPAPTAGKTTAPAGPRDGTYTGPVVTTQWGPVQVRITIAGGRLTDVTALQTPNGNSQSVRINQRAVPILRQEALAAQSATIDTVSGASFTSQGYRSSLQSALTSARR